MEKERRSSHQYGSLERTERSKEDKTAVCSGNVKTPQVSALLEAVHDCKNDKSVSGTLQKRRVKGDEEKEESVSALVMTHAEDDVVSMADSTVTVDDIEGELNKIERIRDVLVRRESELRYMMDDIQLCKEITRLKKELHKLVSIPDNDKSNEDRQKEEELLQQIHKLVETRDFLVDDVEFERLREKEEDKEMADFLKSKFTPRFTSTGIPRRNVPNRAQQSSSPFTKTGLNLLKECCGFTCSVM